jgi:hypothetical protein
MRRSSLVLVAVTVEAVALFGTLRIASPGRQRSAKTTLATSLAPFAHCAIDQVAVAVGGSLPGFSQDVGQA